MDGNQSLYFKKGIDSLISGVEFLSGKKEKQFNKMCLQISDGRITNFKVFATTLNFFPAINATLANAVRFLL